MEDMYGDSERATAVLREPQPSLRYDICSSAESTPDRQK